MRSLWSLSEAKCARKKSTRREKQRSLEALPAAAAEVLGDEHGELGLLGEGHLATAARALRRAGNAAGVGGGGGDGGRRGHERRVATRGSGLGAAAQAPLRQLRRAV